MMAWMAASPSECPSGPRGSSGKSTPATRIGRPATSRWASNPIPHRTPAGRSAALPGATRDVARAARVARMATRSVASVSFRFSGSPGMTWTGTPAAASAPASSVIGRPQAWASSIAARRAPEPRGLRGLGGGDLLPLDRREDAVVADALQRVDHRHDGNHGAVDAGDSGGHGPHEGRADGRTRGIVHQHERLVVVVRRP